MKFDSTLSSEHAMTINGLSVALNMPAAIKDDGDSTNRLPPRRTRKAFIVDEYPACPNNWMRSSGRVKSYFVPVVDGAGLWLDFNGCDSSPHYVAAIVSIQGINALSGLPTKDAALEQFRDSCPIHKKNFGPDRLCRDCGFKWPRQNYLTNAAQPHGQFWIDGFKTSADSVTRQFILSKNNTRGVAKAIIGEDRVFALGVSFFISKTQKPKPDPSPLRGIGNWGGAIGCDHVDGLKNGWGSPAIDWTDSSSYDHSIGPPKATTWSCNLSDIQSKCLDDSTRDKPQRRSALAGSYTRRRIGGQSVNCSAPIKVEKMEIAAGARIDQKIYDDPNGLGFWSSEPEGMIVINYASESDCVKIIEAGRIDLSGSKEGFMTGIPVGNK